MLESEWLLQSSPIFFDQAGVEIPVPQGGESPKHVMSFRTHSHLITMALDHFLSLCWPIESSSRPTLSHARCSSIHLLLLSNLWLPLLLQQRRRRRRWRRHSRNEWSCLRNADTKGGMSFYQVLPPHPTPPHTLAHLQANGHTQAPHKGRHG